MITKQTLEILIVHRSKGNRRVYIFYDTETTGLNAAFDQILQIALVFTDEKLNILASKKIECRRSPWVVPSPGALLITGFSPDDLKNAKLSQYEMMHQVVDWMKSQHWPLTFAGYNTFGFDEGIMAQNFHQSLLDPNLTTATNPFNNQRNGRVDVMTLVKAVIAYMPGALKIGTLNDFGTISISLGSIAAQNGINLSAHDAHDAMNDIRATVGVAKLIQKVAPDIWTHMGSLTTYEAVDQFTKSHTIFTHSIVTGGKANAVVATEVADGMIFDVGVDPQKYLSMTVEQLRDVLLHKKTDPFRKINKSMQPIIMPIEKSDAVLPATFDQAQAESRAALLKDPAFTAKLTAAIAIVEAANVKPATVQPEQLLQSPIDPAVKPKLDQWMKDFKKAATWKEKSAVVDRFYTDIGADAVKADPALRRFVNFAGRVVFENAPHELSGDKALKMRQYIAARILNPDPEAPYTTIAKARRELDKIEQDRNEKKSEKWLEVKDSDIRALKLYYTSIEKEYAPFMPESYKKPIPQNDNAAVKKPIEPKFKP